jgi:hypothetical protein
MTTNVDASDATVQATLFEDEAFWAEELPTELALLDFEEPPLLLVDTDPERAVARQKQLMDTCFGGIGEETKVEKRMGLAMQQLDIEQRHALRLLLIYQDAAELTAHLQRCLTDPAYGYGADGRGDNGRTIAQAMAALAEDSDLSGPSPAAQGLAGIAGEWLAVHRDFQQRVLGGIPFSFRSLFDFGDLDSFVPLVQRLDALTWRLGVEGEGKHRDFQGSVADIWPRLCNTYVEWSEADNDAWLGDLKRQAARLPDTIFRAARADRLRKEKDGVTLTGNKITLVTERGVETWPRMLTMSDHEGNGMLGLSRLSGHSFFELAWEGGLHVRRFEVSSTTRQKVPFEHIELAMLLAETIGARYDLRPEPVTAAEVEVAYLRRMKATEAEVGPPPVQELPPAIQGQPVASYRVGQVLVTLLQGGDDFAYVTVTGSDNAVLLRRDGQRGVMAALPVMRGRPQRGHILMTTPLAELSQTAEANRALCAWGAWLAWATTKG